MTPDRLAEIRALLSDSTACEFADLTLTCGELLAELDRLRAAGERLQKYTVSFRRGFDDDMSIYPDDEYGTWFEVDDVIDLFTPASPRSPAGAA